MKPVLLSPPGGAYTVWAVDEQVTAMLEKLHVEAGDLAYDCLYCLRQHLPVCGFESMPGSMVYRSEDHPKIHVFALPTIEADRELCLFMFAGDSDSIVCAFLRFVEDEAAVLNGMVEAEEVRQAYVLEFGGNDAVN